MEALPKIRAWLVETFPALHRADPARVELALPDFAVDRVREVRLAAVKAIAELPPSPATSSTLGDRLRDPDHEVRDEAIRSLGRIGPGARRSPRAWPHS